MLIDVPAPTAEIAATSERPSGTFWLAFHKGTVVAHCDLGAILQDPKA